MEPGTARDPVSHVVPELEGVGLIQEVLGPLDLVQGPTEPCSSVVGGDTREEEPWVSFLVPRGSLSGFVDGDPRGVLGGF